MLKSGGPNWPKLPVLVGMLRRLLTASRKFKHPSRDNFWENPFRCFATCQDKISIHSLAVYIHEQINGTFEDIFPKLYERVDTLEYPNSGSSTLVSMDDAVVIVEDIGAHTDDLEAFLARDQKLDKSIDFPVPDDPYADLHGSQKPRHPFQAGHGLKKNDRERIVMPTHGLQEDLSTEELVTRSKKHADGIWFKPSWGRAFMVYSRTSSTYILKRVKMDRFPVDPTFNVWYQTHMSPGWMACGGACARGSPPQWWNVNEEDHPFTNRELERKGCIGYCAMARTAQFKANG